MGNIRSLKKRINLSMKFEVIKVERKYFLKPSYKVLCTVGFLSGQLMFDLGSYVCRNSNST